MKIAFVSTYDSEDIRNWSGTPYYMARALARRGNRIQFIGNLSLKPSLWQKIKRRWFMLRGKGYDLERSPEILKKFAREIEQRMDKDVDILFAPSSQPLVYCTARPTVFYTDATFAGMLDYYDIFSNLSRATIRDGNIVEQHALDHAALAIFSSQWAADTAAQFYNVHPRKIKVINYGANVECNRTIADIEKIIQDKPLGACNLLFLGVNWERKGGPKAVEVVNYLNQNSIPAILHIVGIKDLPIRDLPAHIINHGFISKATEAGQKQINALLAQAHFLLLPTVADCTPIVYAEANSFGLPCLTTDTGGVSSLIRNGKNGQLFALDAPPEAYAAFLREYFLDKENYRKLCLSSFAEYRQRLNWDSCAESIMQELNKLKI